MIARCACVVALTLLGAAFAPPAEANWLRSIYFGVTGAPKAFVRDVVRNTKRRQCWPKPFVCPDRSDVRAPLAIVISNGWRSQNLLGDHHFQAGEGLLTEAGRLKIQWILTEAPRHRRTIYVYRARSREETAARIDAVHQYAARLVPQGELPPVLETSIPAHGWPAERVDAIERKLQASTPDPVLPQASDTNGGT